MYDLIASVLAFFYDLWPGQGGYGIAIVMLTIAVMIVVTPLTFKSTKSMIAMQRLQPEVAKIRERHGSDRQAMNEEMMALYQSEGINPAGGCLPMLIQIPVFLVLYSVVRGITRRTSQLGLELGSRAGFEAVFRAAPTAAEPVGDFPERTFNPAYLNNDSEMYRDLSESTEMRSFGFDLAESARSVLADSISESLPYLILILIVGVTAYIQQRQIAGRNPSATRNPQQELIMKVLPFFLPLISFTLPAAVVLYFVISNIFRLGQQTIITRRYYGENYPVAIETTAEEVEPDPEPVVERPTRAPTAVRERTTPSAGGGGKHGSRRPTSRPPKPKRTSTEPKPGPSKTAKPGRAAGGPTSRRNGGPAAGAGGQKPVKPSKSKKGGRVTPKGGKPQRDPDAR